MIVRTIRLLLASGFLAAVAHVAPVAERAALGITRVEDLAPEAIARPLGEIRAARLQRRRQTDRAGRTLHARQRRIGLKAKIPSRGYGFLFDRICATRRKGIHRS
jgi:hypothetical protein